MKIKLINPNTTLEMTESIRLVAEKYKAAGTEIIAVSPQTGPDSIETFMDDYLAVPGVLKEIIDGDRKEHADAYVIACFGDPGLKAAREVTTKPVIGIAEAAILISELIAPSVCGKDGAQWLFISCRAPSFFCYSFSELFH